MLGCKDKLRERGRQTERKQVDFKLESENTGLQMVFVTALARTFAATKQNTVSVQLPPPDTHPCKSEAGSIL